MHANKVWLFFLALVVVAMLWFDIHAIREWRRYHRLSAQAPAHITLVRVQEERGNRYVLIAHYFFDFRERSYWGEAPLAPPYRNPWAAEQARSGMQNKAWEVWFNPRYPSESTILKSFPLKEVLSAFLLTVLSCYFFGLGFFVGGQRGNRSS